MKKIKFPVFGRKKSKHTIRFSIAFKTSILYTLLFSGVLAVVVGAMIWVLSDQASHYKRLRELSGFLSEQMSSLHGKQFDYESFALANNVFLEISGPDRKTVVTYGIPPSSNRNHAEIHCPLRLSGRPLLLHAVDRDDGGLAINLSVDAFYLIFAALLLLAAVLGAILMRRMMRPVYSMMQTARSITGNALDQRIQPVRSHDELNELAETFNGMLDRIQTSYEQQKRFVSDASHELRTPLSVISGYANLLRRWGGEDRAIREESVAKIIQETANMQQLVERLLFLARADQHTQQIHPELFCVSNMMEEIIEETRLIDEKHKIIERIEPDVMLTADPVLIRQAVRAVVENSCKYTPAGGTIHISCGTEQGCTVLEVSDNGIGISKTDLPHIFDRFYKADEARTRSTKSSSGLGLSIVKWIVERHNGSIAVASAQNQGTAIRMAFPQKSFLPG